jgi:acyl-CoA synthetase
MHSSLFIYIVYWKTFAYVFQVLTNLLLKYNAEIVNDDILRQMGIILVKLDKVMRNRISLAYCITTSGTTGSPKIVKVPDKCIVPNIIFQR